MKQLITLNLNLQILTRHLIYVGVLENIKSLQQYQLLCQWGQQPFSCTHLSFWNFSLNINALIQLWIFGLHALILNFVETRILYGELTGTPKKVFITLQNNQIFIVLLTCKLVFLELSFWQEQQLDVVLQLGWEIFMEGNQYFYHQCAHYL